MCCRHCGCQSHSLRQAAGHARLAPVCRFTVLRSDKSAKPCTHARRLLEPTAQPFTTGSSSFGLCSNCTLIQSTTSQRKRKIVFLVRTWFLRDFSSKTQEHHPKAMWDGVSRFCTSGGPGELPAPHPLCTFPMKEKALGPLTDTTNFCLPLHCIPFVSRHSGHAKEIAVEKRASR